MPRTIPRMAGVISVVVFGGLLGFLVFGGCQGEESDQDALATPVKVQPTDEWLTGPTAMSLEIAPQDSPSLTDYYELAAPEALSPAAAISRSSSIHQDSVSLMIDYERFACVDGSPRLLFRIPEALPPGAMVNIWPTGEWVIESPGYPSTGPAYESPIPIGIAAFQVDIASVLANEGTKHVQVMLRAQDSRTIFVSMPAVVDTSGVDCGTPR